jgi:hypothetical protein
MANKFMNTKKQWKDDVIDVKKLELDLQNPRQKKVSGTFYFPFLTFHQRRTG